MTERIKAVEEDVREVKGDIKDIKSDLKKVLDYMSEERGMRTERDRNQKVREKETDDYRADTKFRIEIGWTKVMALAAVGGIFVAAATSLIAHLSGFAK